MLRGFLDTIILIYCLGMFLSYDWSCIKEDFKGVQSQKIVYNNSNGNHQFLQRPTTEQ